MVDRVIVYVGKGKKPDYFVGDESGPTGGSIDYYTFSRKYGPSYEQAKERGEIQLEYRPLPERSRWKTAQEERQYEQSQAEAEVRYEEKRAAKGLPPTPIESKKAAEILQERAKEREQVREKKQQFKVYQVQTAAQKVVALEAAKQQVKFSPAALSLLEQRQQEEASKVLRPTTATAEFMGGKVKYTGTVSPGPPVAEPAPTVKAKTTPLYSKPSENILALEVSKTYVGHSKKVKELIEQRQQEEIKKIKEPTEATVKMGGVTYTGTITQGEEITKVTSGKAISTGFKPPAESLLDIELAAQGIELPEKLTMGEKLNIFTRDFDIKDVIRGLGEPAKIIGKDIANIAKGPPPTSPQFIIKSATDRGYRKSTERVAVLGGVAFGYSLLVPTAQVVANLGISSIAVKRFFDRPTSKQLGESIFVLGVSAAATYTAVRSSTVSVPTKQGTLYKVNVPLEQPYMIQGGHTGVLFANKVRPQVQTLPQLRTIDLNPYIKGTGTELIATRASIGTAASKVIIEKPATIGGLNLQKIKEFPSKAKGFITKLIPPKIKFTFEKPKPKPETPFTFEVTKMAGTLKDVKVPFTIKDAITPIKVPSHEIKAIGTAAGGRVVVSRTPGQALKDIGELGVGGIKEGVKDVIEGKPIVSVDLSLPPRLPKTKITRTTTLTGGKKLEPLEVSAKEAASEVLDLGFTGLKKFGDDIIKDREVFNMRIDKYGKPQREPPIFRAGFSLQREYNVPPYGKVELSREISPKAALRYFTGKLKPNDIIKIQIPKANIKIIRRELGYGLGFGEVTHKVIDSKFFRFQYTKYGPQRLVSSRDIPEKALIDRDGPPLDIAAKPKIIKEPIETKKTTKIINKVEPISAPPQGYRYVEDDITVGPGMVQKVVSLQELETLGEIAPPVSIPQVKSGFKSPIFYPIWKSKRGQFEEGASALESEVTPLSELEVVQITKPETTEEEKRDSKIDIGFGFIPGVDVGQGIDSKIDIDTEVVQETEVLEKPEPPEGGGITFFGSDRGVTGPEQRPAYYAQAKEKGRFVNLHKKPLPKYKALNLGAEVVDNTSSATFRLKQATKRTNMMDDLTFTKKHKFRASKGQYIEENKHRIDSRGEIEGITVKGWLAQRRSKLAF